MVYYLCQRSKSGSWLVMASSNSADAFVLRPNSVIVSSQRPLRSSAAIEALAEAEWQKRNGK